MVLLAVIVGALSTVTMTVISLAVSSGEHSSIQFCPLVSLAIVDADAPLSVALQLLSKLPVPLTLAATIRYPPLSTELLDMIEIPVTS